MVLWLLTPSEYWYKTHAGHFEFPLCVDAAIFPESLECFEPCFCFGYMCFDVVVRAGVLSDDDDAQVSDQCFDFDCGWVACAGVCSAVLWVEADLLCGAPPDELAISRFHFKL